VRMEGEPCNFIYRLFRRFLPYEAFVTLLTQHLNRNPQQRDVQVTVDFEETTDRVVVGPDNSRC